MNERCSNESAMAEKTAFCRILINSNYGKEPLQILEKPAGSPFFPQKGVISFTAGWHTHNASSFIYQVLLTLCMEITSTQPVDVICLVF